MNLSKILTLEIEKCLEFQRSLEIINANSEGKVWLIGGMVYRTIAHKLYGSQKPEVDLDFIIEKPITNFKLPTGWIITSNRFGNPKLINHNGTIIDFIPLNNIYSIQKRNLEPKIENFLTGVPLKIQSIAYDINQKEIIGELGLKSLVNRLIEINDLNFAKYAANKKGITVNEMIKEKADSLRFRPVYI